MKIASARILFKTINKAFPVGQLYVWNIHICTIIYTTYMHASSIKEVTKTIERIFPLQCNKLVNNTTCMLVNYICT